jgi:hypothetical protein
MDSHNHAENGVDTWVRCRFVNSRSPVRVRRSAPAPSMAGAEQAEVAEPADALRSGRSEGNLVGVQISPSAPRTVRVAWSLSDWVAG